MNGYFFDITVERTTTQHASVRVFVPSDCLRGDGPRRFAVAAADSCDAWSDQSTTVSTTSLNRERYASCVETKGIGDTDAVVSEP